MRSESKSIFFYGSLRDRALLEAVLGRAVAIEDFQPATARHHAAFGIKGEDYPALISSPDGYAEGVFVTHLNDNDFKRLEFFEEAEYGLEDIAVDTASGVQSTVYFKGTPKIRLTGEPWDFERWKRDHRVAALFAARELMSLFGSVPVEKIDHFWPGIMRRAHQYARAQGKQAPSMGIGHGFGQGDIERKTSERLASGFVTLDAHRLRHKRHDGGWSEELSRVVASWGDVATVLPFDPRRDEVLLIEQFRAAPAVRGDTDPWCIEVIAGLIDGSEDPETTIRREAQEEAGVEIGRVAKIGEFYATPGVVSEYHYAFLGEADLTGAGGVFGLDAEGEDIRAFVMTAEAAIEAADAGAIRNAPALIALSWLARHRERMKAMWID